MSGRDARFEVCCGDLGGGWWARFRAANGRVVWVTETYRRRRDAVRAIEIICGRPVIETPHNDHPEVMWIGSDRPTEVHFLDEREGRP